MYPNGGAHSIFRHSSISKVFPQIITQKAKPRDIAWFYLGLHEVEDFHWFASIKQKNVVFRKTMRYVAVQIPQLSSCKLPNLEVTTPRDCKNLAILYLVVFQTAGF